MLVMVFTAKGQITNIRIVRGLPDGLTEKAIEAARKIRFLPAKKNGIPVNVRGNLEFTFNLYDLPAPLLLSPGNNEILDNFPRKITLKWSPVTGAVKYKVSVEYADQEGKNWSL